MQIIETTALPNGAHRNQTGDFRTLPEGWAVVPEEMEIPETFPFVNIETEDGVVTSMTAGTVPEPEPEPGPEPEPEYVTYEELAAAIREGVNAVD